MSELIRFLKQEEGVTLVEYGLITALIAATILLAVNQTGGYIEAVFNTFAAIF